MRALKAPYESAHARERYVADRHQHRVRQQATAEPLHEPHRVQHLDHWGHGPRLLSRQPRLNSRRLKKISAKRPISGAAIASPSALRDHGPCHQVVHRECARH